MTHGLVTITNGFAPGAQSRESSMQTVVRQGLPHLAPSRPSSIGSALLLAVSWPFFVVVEALARGVARLADPSGEHSVRPTRSIFAEANENASITVSYARMARKTLQNSARTQRSERTS